MSVLSWLVFESYNVRDQSSLWNLDQSWACPLFADATHFGAQRIQCLVHYDQTMQGIER